MCHWISRLQLFAVLGFFLFVACGAGQLNAQETVQEEASAEAGIAGETSAENTSPPYPAGLDDPTIELDDLQLRLLPLTVEELEALSGAWLANARAATEAFVDKIIEI